METAELVRHLSGSIGLQNGVPGVVGIEKVADLGRVEPVKAGEAEALTGRHLANRPDRVCQISVREGEDNSAHLVISDETSDDRLRTTAAKRRETRVEHRPPNAPCRIDRNEIREDVKLD